MGMWETKPQAPSWKCWWTLISDHKLGTDTWQTVFCVIDTPGAADSRIAICAGGVQVRDIAVVVKGCRYPMVLRRIKTGELVRSFLPLPLRLYKQAPIGKMTFLAGLLLLLLLLLLGRLLIQGPRCRLQALINSSDSLMWMASWRERQSQMRTSGTFLDIRVMSEPTRYIKGWPNSHSRFWSYYTGSTIDTSPIT